MNYVGVTDLGQVRSGNEDCYGFDAARRVAVLADGMGGLNAGEIASAAAVRAFLSAVPEGCDSAALAAAARHANEQVFALSRASIGQGVMGTTLVASVAFDSAAGEARWLFANIGDSRAYLLRDGALTQVTRDHSVVQELTEQGVLTADEARVAPNRHVITRAVGLEPEVDPDIAELERQGGDLVLLCSDGLTDMLHEEAIVDVLTASDSLAVAADQLVAAANRAGGVDNISVVLIR
ncbi:MAG: Stp1/IreP family PP2C-type Ser/Thr phosphatase [Pseudomonadota bacterium]